MGHRAFPSAKATNVPTGGLGADVPSRANAGRTLAIAGKDDCRAFGVGQRREDLLVLLAKNGTILRNWFVQPAPQPLRQVWGDSHMVPHGQYLAALRKMIRVAGMGFPSLTRWLPKVTMFASRTVIHARPPPSEGGRLLLTVHPKKWGSSGKLGSDANREVGV
jgi:hypothetical protein